MKRNLPNIVLLVVAIGATYVLLQRAFYANTSFNVQWAQDLAFFNQIFYSALKGGEWSSPLLLEPTGFFKMVHFHPIIALLLPFYAIWPEPSTLLTFNVLAVVIAVFPLTAITKEVTNSPWFSVSAGVAYLTWLPTQAAALADFRPMVFLIPGLMTLLWGASGKADLKHRLIMIIGALICFSAREEAAYIVTSIGIVLLMLPIKGFFRLGQHTRLDGLILTIAGLLYLGFLLLFKENFFFHFNPLTFFESASSNSPPSELTTERLAHLAGMVGSGFAPMLLSVPTILMAIPPLAYLLSDPAKEWHSFMGTYPYFRHILIPFFCAGGVIGWSLVFTKYQLKKPSQVALASSVLLVFTALDFYQTRKGVEAVWNNNKINAGSVEVIWLQRMVDLVPDNGAVVTDYKMIAALSGRKVLWNQAHMYMEDGRPSHWTDDWPITLDIVDWAFLPDDSDLFKHMKNWTLVEQRAGYQLWKKELNN